MALTQQQKQDVRKSYGRTTQDTGSPEVQVALLTTRINEITEHLKLNPKDYASRRGLMILVGRRRRLLNYYKKTASAEQYKDILNRLKLRK